jgi:hypothetical protein
MNHCIVSIPDGWFHSPEGETDNLFYRLKGDRLLNDAGLDRFAKMFNQWEKDKSMEDDEYKPAMMISPFFIDDLLNPNKKERNHMEDLGLLLVVDQRDCMLEQTSSIQSQQFTFCITLVIGIGPILLWILRLCNRGFMTAYTGLWIKME